MALSIYGMIPEAQVFVNGEKVCEWPYGYNAFAACSGTPPAYSAM